MKAICLGATLALLLLAGCNDSTNPQKGSASGNPATAPADYLNTAAKAQQRAVKTVDVVAVNKAIEAFYVQEGRFPKDLLELVEMNYIRLIPKLPEGASWDYDTNTGVVMINKRPD